MKGCKEQEGRICRRRKAGKAAAVLFWTGVWFLGAAAVGNKVLLAGPAETAAELFSLAGSPRFYVTVGNSLLRVGAGFGAGFLAALVLAAGSFRFPLLEDMAAPVVSLAKAVPVASFVILLLIWRGPSFLAAAVCFLVVIPGIYFNTLEGLGSMDPALLEMAGVFRMPFWNRFFYIYRPALKPFLQSSLKSSLGMCWKAGVAAEVIGVPEFSIGERLYLSKVYLDTAGIFAWTAVTVLLSILLEKLVLRLAELFFRWEPSCRRKAVPKRAPAEGGIVLKAEGIVKRYGGRTVLDGVGAEYAPGEIYYLGSPSGTGKTTFLHVLAGLTEPDEGSVTAGASCSMVFQEDRLCEEYSAVKNVELVTGDRERSRQALRELLEEEALDKPCRELSGGMKRRVALVRAMEAESEFVLLDEPFTGMDQAACGLAREYIKKMQKGRILVIASHHAGKI